MLIKSLCFIPQSSGPVAVFSEQKDQVFHTLHVAWSKSNIHLQKKYTKIFIRMMHINRTHANDA